MKNESQVGAIFARLIEQAEQELLCEKRDGCTHCGLCPNAKAKLASREVRKEFHVHAAAVSTD